MKSHPSFIWQQVESMAYMIEWTSINVLKYNPYWKVLAVVLIVNNNNFTHFVCIIEEISREKYMFSDNIICNASFIQAMKIRSLVNLIQLANADCDFFCNVWCIYSSLYMYYKSKYLNTFLNDINCHLNEHNMNQLKSSL